jgi:UDP-N-acetylglucosamine 1-carboxyvinyltransferase
VVGGAKNAALPIMAAALAADGPSILYDVPDLVDVATLSQLLETLGCNVQRQQDGGLRLEVFDDERFVADYELVRRMRAGVCVLGPMLARRGKACVSLPGGCNIGDRPIDLHLKGLRALGADIRIERGYVIAEADRLRGADIYLGGPFGSTVTGTANVMSAAALADGVTTIEAAACEPEVVDLGNFLNRMGAHITGLGTPFLRIEGVERLTGAEHTVIPDRIEAATLMIAVAATGGRVEVENVCPSHMTAVIEKLREVGVECGVRSVECGVSTTAASNHSALRTPTSTLTISVSAPLRPADVIALPYPGIPTDLQAQLTALLCGAEGISVVTDKVFPDRFMHAAELVRMGAQIRREGYSAIVSGVSHRSGACVMASDLRASAALVISALAAHGESVIRRIYHLDRGYDRLEAKLNSLGADIRRVKDEPANMPASLAPAIIDGTRPNAVSAPHWLSKSTERQKRTI